MDGKTLTFVVSGRLWRNSLVMTDEETGSQWSHVDGRAYAGPLKGERLEIVPSVQTTWAAWRAEHPDTRLLAKSREITSSRYESYFEDPKKTGLFRGNWLAQRMPGKSKVHGLVRGPHALAVADERLEPGDPVNTEVGGEPVVVVRGDDGGVRAYVASLAGKRLDFRPSKDAPGDLLVERGGKSRFDPVRGAFVSGPLEGRSLEEIPATVAFWFAWSAFYPNTAVVD